MHFFDTQSKRSNKVIDPTHDLVRMDSFGLEQQHGYRKANRKAGVNKSEDEPRQDLGPNRGISFFGDSRESAILHKLRKYVALGISGRAGLGGEEDAR